MLLSHAKSPKNAHFMKWRPQRESNLVGYASGNYCEPCYTTISAAFVKINALLHQRFPRRKTAPFFTRLLPRPLPDSVTSPVQAELNPHAGSAPLVFLTDTFSGETLCGGDFGRGHPSRNDVSIFRCVLNIPR